MLQHHQKIQEATEGELFRLLVENVTDYAIFVIDPEGRVRSWNPGAQRLLRYSENEIIGQPAALFYTPEDIEDGVPQREIDKAREMGRDEDARWHVRKDGSRFWSAATITPLWDEGRNLRGFAKIMRDCTSQKHNDTALKEALAYSKEVVEERREIETHFTSLVKHIKDHAIIAMDPEGHITSANVEAEHILGYTEAEMLGKPFSMIFNPKDVQDGIPGQELRIAKETGRALDERWHFCKGGREFWALGIVTPKYDASGKHTGFSKILRDMTEQKLAGEQLQQAKEEAKSQVRERTAELKSVNEELQQEVAERRCTEQAVRLRDRVIQAVSQGIMITNPNLPDNPIIYASHGFERMTGYRADEVLGRNCRFLQGKETDPEAVTALREAVRAGRECSVEFLNYRKDGTKFWNALFVTPVRDEDQRLTHFVGVQADVTGRRTLEQAFHQSQKMEAFGQLAGGVAHDFNNLLTIISGFSEMVLGRLRPDDPCWAMIQQVHKAGERAAGLTRQLLAFSRQTVLEPKILDLNAIVRDIEKMLQRLIGEDVMLTTVLAPSLYQAKVDPGQIEQVIMNLAVNARDAMPQGGNLTIETGNVDLDQNYAATHPEVKPGRYVMLAMTDTGSGMTPEVQAHIFEPFFTTKEPGKGTGLGLATVYGIVKQSGGSVYLYSEVGRGTTIKVYLPAVKNVVSTGKSLHGVKINATGTEMILLVEDEDAVRSMVHLVLQQLGYTILEARRGAEAIRLCEQHEGKIHLLVTDVVMPEMGGRQLAEHVTQLRPGIKVLYLSGYTDDAVVRHGVLQAEVAFLQKPFTMAALANKVRQVLDEKTQ